MNHYTSLSDETKAEWLNFLELYASNLQNQSLSPAAINVALRSVLASAPMTLSVQQAELTEDEVAGVMEKLAKHASGPLDKAWTSYSVDLLAEPPPPVEFVWDGYLPKGKVVVLAGAGAGGKSSLVAGLALHRAMGLPFLGRNVRQGTTVIVSTEDDATDFRRKFSAWRSVLGDSYDLTKVAKHVHVVDLAGTPMTLVNSNRGQHSVDPSVEELAGLIKRNAPEADLIVLETVSRLGGGDESNGAMSAVVVAAEQLVQRTGATVILVHHVSKQAGREKTGDAYAARGGSAIGDNARSGLVLTAADKDLLKRLLGDEPTEEQIASLSILFHPKANFSAKSKPIVLERVITPHGIALRVYQPPTGGVDGIPLRVVNGWKLKEFVTGLVKSGHKVSERKLRESPKVRMILGVSKHAIPDAVHEAVEDGFLAWTDEKLPGGTQALTIGPAPCPYNTGSGDDDESGDLF
jgi:hypothetical protein